MERRIDKADMSSGTSSNSNIVVRPDNVTAVIRYEEGSATVPPQVLGVLILNDVCLPTLNIRRTEVPQKLTPYCVLNDEIASLRIVYRYMWRRGRADADPNGN